ncbi:LacI family DNA-binding transcriptional regulator [Glycomyces harbinensis]|uniref:DNA-binding transcriptional regulator, LacI/PurR family n=1 Tax=Glycomyces harbinensis TaxID=58114 RepID=A0A1G7AJX5_9ACTN|nr:LacI family DNA-binding transcriptional regulator [Glycomyces harbinensis]SDE14176.1 DNA-binding transcriptional regulator, LacI/PurR family [Glycomyces harbinensis]
MPPSSPFGETPQRRRPPGMTDVARLAGVSQKTVSRVVNNERYVSDDVREKVLRAARELGFRPNTAARALITGRFRRIGVVSLGTALYGPASLQVAMERATRSAGVSVMVANTLEGQPGAIAEAVEWLLQQGVDAIVISEPIDEDEPVEIDTEVPIYSLGQARGVPEAQNLLTGEFNRIAGREAAEHLLDLGHARVWHVAGPEKWYAARERAQGWRDAHEARGIEPPPMLQGDWSPASGYRAGLQLVRDPDVTAVACANDDMAIGLVRAFTEAGRSVPERVSVTGFDDIPAAAYLTPPLTTIRQRFEADAIRALGTILRRLPGASTDAPEPDPPAPATGPSLVVRASTAPSPSRLKEEPGKDAR